HIQIFFLIFSQFEPPPLRSTLFPYTTLFRSVGVPLFFTISGYRYSYGIDKFTPGIWWQKLKKRFKSLVIPFFTWSILGLLFVVRSEAHTSELQSREKLVCRLLLDKKKYQRPV